MRSALRVGKSVTLLGRPLYLVLPEQQDEVLQEILALNEVLPEVNEALPETAEGVVPLLQIWPSDINFEEPVEPPEDIVDFTHFRNLPARGSEEEVPQALYFRSRNGQTDPMSHAYELDVAGLLLLGPDHEPDLALITLHVDDTFTACRFRRDEDGHLKLDRIRHRTENGEYLRLHDGPKKQARN
ncbi:MAG: hypothetical protein HDQ87_12055 [Clostridia bacterium]|nr:hypothetical protein [Clostridia bacterium]